jgi:hypothetical protein
VTTPQNVLITCATPGATIYYTLDGSEPTTSSAVVPGGGISVTTITVIRAKAFAPPFAANGTDIIRFTYNDKAQWPPAADGSGRSLVLRNPTVANNTNLFLSAAANWRSSATNGGNPGQSDRVVFSGSPLADGDGDGLAAMIEYALLRSDSAPNDGVMPPAVVESIVVSGIAQNYLTLTIPRESRRRQRYSRRRVLLQSHASMAVRHLCRRDRQWRSSFTKMARTYTP